MTDHWVTLLTVLLLSWAVWGSIRPYQWTVAWGRRRVLRHQTAFLRAEHPAPIWSITRLLVEETYQIDTMDRTQHARKALGGNYQYIVDRYYWSIRDIKRAYETLDWSEPHAVL